MSYSLFKPGDIVTHRKDIPCQYNITTPGVLIKVKEIHGADFEGIYTYGDRVYTDYFRMRNFELVKKSIPTKGLAALVYLQEELSNV